MFIDWLIAMFLVLVLQVATRQQRIKSDGSSVAQRLLVMYPLETGRTRRPFTEWVGEEGEPPFMPTKLWRLLSTWGVSCTHCWWVIPLQESWWTGAAYSLGTKPHDALYFLRLVRHFQNCPILGLAFQLFKSPVLHHLPKTIAHSRSYPVHDG